MANPPEPTVKRSLFAELPRLRMEKRESVSKTFQAVIPFASVLVAFVLGAMPLLFYGVNPIEAYTKLIQGAFGSVDGIIRVLIKMTPLLFTSLAVAIPLRAGLWNIGAEGQLHIGAVGATWVALTVLNNGGDASSWIVVPSMILAGAFLAGLYAFIPALLRAKFNTNEIITTLMLNYVAFDIMRFFIAGPWRTSTGNFQTETFPPSASFPEFFGTQVDKVHLGLPIALILVFVIYFIYTKTRIGYEAKVVGANPNAASVGGISQAKVIIWTLTLGGAIGGLAGVGEVAAIQHKLIDGISPSLNPFGYTGIAVALLAKGHPLGLIPATITFSALFVGGSSIQALPFASIYSGETIQVPVAIVLVLEVLVIVSIIAGDYLSRYRMTWRRHG